MSVTSNANRVLLVRKLIRDTDTTRAYFSDAVISTFLHEALVDYDSQIGTVKESQSATFLVTDRTKTLTYAGAVSSIVGARLSTANGKPLDLIDFWQVRHLQEREGRAATPEVAGVQLTSLGSNGGSTFNLAIYPLAGIQVFVVGHTFLLADPTGFQHDMNQAEAAYTVRRAALALAGVMGADDSLRQTIKAQADERYFAGIGLRRTHGAPGIQRDQDVLTEVRSEG